MATYNLPSYKSAPKYSANYEALPTYSAPSWDQSEVSTNTEKNAATGLRALRQTVGKTSAANYESSGAKRMTLRDALAGYGSGIGSTMTAAGATALNDYTTKFSAASKNAEAEYGSRAAAATAKNAWYSDTAAENFKGEMTQWSAENDSADAKAAAEFGSTSDAESAKAGHGYEVETAATAAATAAKVAETKYGYDSEESQTAAKTAADVAARADEYRTAAAATGNAYSVAAEKAKAATDAAAAAEGNQWGKEAAAEAAKVAAKASQAAIDAAWKQYRQKTLWDQEQADEDQLASDAKAKRDTEEADNKAEFKAWQANYATTHTTKR